MSLITLLLVVVAILAFYLRSKIVSFIKLGEKRLDEAKEVITHPQKLASTVGEALIDTAINQVSKMAHKGSLKRT